MRLVGGVFIQRVQEQFIELLVQPGFFVIRPAPQRNAVAQGFHFHHVVHFPLVFKFMRMFPTKFASKFSQGKLPKHQGFLINAGGHTLFDGFFRLYFLNVQTGKSACHRGNQTKKE